MQGMRCQCSMLTSSSRRGTRSAKSTIANGRAESRRTLHDHRNLRSTSTTNRGWIVTFAGTGINLALGILYAWSMFKGAIEKEFGWKGAQLNDPYALCCLVFAFAMILAGRCQDKFGPRLTASIGGLLVGAGFLLCLDHEQLRRLAARLRRAGRHRHRLRLFVRHAARAEMVSAVEDRPDRRPGRGGLRPGAGLSRADVRNICSGHYQVRSIHADLRHRFRGHRVRSGATAA